MCLTPPTDEDNVAIDAASQDSDTPSIGGQSHVVREIVQVPAPARDEEQVEGMMDIVVANSQRVAWSGSPINSDSPSTRLSEEEPISPQCVHGATDFPPEMMLCLHPHRNQALDSLERLLGILDQALEIVNAN